MNALPPRDHNNPPSPIDEALRPFGDDITEAEAWADGTAVETEGQMDAVDALIKRVKAAKKAVEAAEDDEAKPLYQAWKDAKARYAPTLTDLDRLSKCLVAAVDGFKRKLAAEKAEAERKARAEAEAAMRSAREAAAKADAANIEAQREVEAAMRAAEEATAKARAAANDTVKGLRQTWFHEVTDHRAALHDIARNDRDAVTRFVEEYARTHYRQRAIDGVRVWSEKVAV